MEEKRRPRLLLADRSPTIRKVVELTFADEGVDVTSVADSQSAMREFLEIQPDIMLVDVSLSGTSGYQMCEMIKADEATRHLPVLLLVGSFEPFDQAEAERVGADGFLTKPFHSVRDLVANVFDQLGKKVNSSEVVPENAHQVVGQIDSSEPAITEDIDDLYTSSFAQTSEIEEFETVEDLFVDSGLDDELIETTYPTEKFSNDFQTPGPVSEAESDLDMTAFDWSPTAVVSLDELAFETPVSRGFEPKFVFDDLDKEEADESSALPPDVDLPGDDRTNEDVSSMAESGYTVTANRTDHHQADNFGYPELDEPSPEFISLIAQRIVEKLSDKVIREIAQEAVPRIAEKLIREALKEEGGR